MRRALMILLCCLVAPLPSGARAAPEVTAQLPVEVLAAPGLQPLARMARDFGFSQQLRTLTDRLRDRQQDAATEEGAFPYTLGDLSGDGRDDMAIVHYRWKIIDGGTSYNTRITVTIVEGRSGRELWNRRITGRDVFVFPIPARVSNGRQGVWLLEVRGMALGTTEITWALKAIAPAGKRLWSWSASSRIVGQWPFDFTADNYLVTLDRFDAMPGSASDALVAAGPTHFSITASSGIITAGVIDGRNGQANNLSVIEVGARLIPFAVAMRDLDEDRGDDFIFVTEGPTVAVGDPEDPIDQLEPWSGVAKAFGSRSGSNIWTVGGIDLADQNIWAHFAGDVTGDGVGDLFVETTSVFFSPDLEEKYRTYVIDGGLGDLLWERPGSAPYSPGDIDGDGRKDFLTQGFYSAEGYAATRIWAYSSRGKRLWTREHRTEHPLETCCSTMFHFGDTWGVGDLNRDRLSDGYLWHPVGSFEARDEENLLVDAQRGRLLMRGDETVLPLAASVDRGTTDVIDLDWTLPNELVVKVFNGTGENLRVGSRLRFDIPVLPVDRDFYVEGARLTADKCADIWVWIWSPKSDHLLVISGGSGKLLWGRSIAGPSGDVSLVENTDQNKACAA